MKRYAICLRHSRRKKRRSRKELLRQQQSTAAGGKVFCPTFCTLQKVGELPPAAAKGFHFVRAKSPLWCADSRFCETSNLPKGRRVYSFRLYEKNGEYHRGLRTSGLRGRFKALSKKISAKFSDGTSRNRFFVQNGGEKALNRCDVPALQRKDLERTSKGQPYSLRTVGYGWVEICGVGCGNWRL